MIPRQAIAGCLAAAAALFALSWSGAPPLPGRGFATRAEAIIGRPLTPLSYAGVARRTTRRALAYGAVAGTAGAYAYPRAGCVQVADAYGRVVTRCR